MRLRLAVALMSLVVLAGACGGTDDNPQPAGGQETPLPDDQQTLTAATPGDVYITRDKVNLAIWPDNANVCETLVGLSESLQPVPALATKWTNVGNNTFRFELRREVMFHNNTRLTADAVKYSFTRAVDKRNTLNTFLGADSVKVVDEYTVDITPTQPNARLPEQISHPFLSIIAPGTEPATQPVCTGPFVFGSYSPNDRLVVTRNEAYWGQKARLKQMTFRFIPDANTRRLALEAGEVDIEWFLAPQQTPDVMARPGLRVAPAPPGATVDLSMNLNGEPGYDILKDADVRRAFGMSLDAKALADFWRGTAQVVPGVSPPAVLGPSANLVKGVTTNLTQAEALLEARGWKKGADGIREKDGRKLALIVAAQFDFHPDALPLLQAQARRAGIDLKLEQSPDAAAYSAKINSGKWDVDVNYFNQNDANPVRIPAQFWGSKTNNARVKLTNPGTAFDRLVDEANNAPDLATSQLKSAEANTELVSTTAGAIALTSFPQIYALKSSVAGFTPHPSVNHQSWTTVFRTATS
ncbi:MAG: ABC transporter substrate-binding protein [Acidimicrobiales bacterium]